MSRSLKSYPEAQRYQVAQNRIKGETKGLGYLAALDYMKAKVRQMKKVEALKGEPTA